MVLRWDLVLRRLLRFECVIVCERVCVFFSVSICLSGPCLFVSNPNSLVAFHVALRLHCQLHSNVRAVVSMCAFVKLIRTYESRHSHSLQTRHECNVPFFRNLSPLSGAATTTATTAATATRATPAAGRAATPATTPTTSRAAGRARAPLASAEQTNT